MSIGIIAAGLAVLTGFGAGIGIGIATGHASDAINSTLLLGCAMAEGTAIFGFITALIIIFVG